MDIQSQVALAAAAAATAGGPVVSLELCLISAWGASGWIVTGLSWLAEWTGTSKTSLWMLLRTDV